MKKYIPNTITSMNLLSGAIGVIFTLSGRLDLAFLLMLCAAVFDFCDGLAARLLGAYSEIGKELDSLADMVSFGLLPSLMLFALMKANWGLHLLSFLPLFLAVMSALRLAKFNIDERQGENFIGLATPSAAMVCGSLATFVYQRPDTALASLCASAWALPLLAFVLGLLLVSECPFFGMKIKRGARLLDAKRIVFLLFAILLLMGVYFFHYHWSLFILGSFLFYILENLILAPWQRK